MACQWLQSLFSFPLRGNGSLEPFWSPCTGSKTRRASFRSLLPKVLGKSCSCQRAGVTPRSPSTARRVGLQLPLAVRKSRVRDTILSRFEAVLNCAGRSNHSCWPPGLEVTKNCLLPKPDTLQSWAECSLVEAGGSSPKVCSNVSVSCGLVL